MWWSVDEVERIIDGQRIVIYTKYTIKPNWYCYHYLMISCLCLDFEMLFPALRQALSRAPFPALAQVLRLAMYLALLCHS
jgi:hypothetical protein